ncbi:MAG: M1 family peptidase, partial [Bacteroidota bacterium]
DGSKLCYHIPLRIMRGEKEAETKEMDYKVAEDWPWTHPNYELVIPVRYKKIAKVEIDPTGRMADLGKENNVFEIKENKP